MLIAFSYIADLIFGDPEWFPHPVRGMGKLISLLDRKLKGKSSWWVERVKGGVLAFLVLGISTSLAYLFLTLASYLHPYLWNLAWVCLGWTTISIKDLRVKAKAILQELEKDSLLTARKNLSKIVGRDTQNLDKKGIITASIESIAESTCDGIVTPLFYLILGGPVLAIAYKAINTLDSMVGYKNENYLHFGWFSARLDDAANFIPARISGFLICVASFILRNGFSLSFKTMLRDGKKHCSPNSGISEAAMAGALGIRLGGNCFYQGELCEKPFIGEAKKEVILELINRALTISLISSLLILIIGVVVHNIWRLFLVSNG
ncbi:adenosylcobinamide-phosphate synthase CbiB [bacterium]|nr:adenosylcobinamide-phosphate synthase CbiB [bacterium]MBU1753593.1 adenosylcobinamide-phosphate synthase CbiB [bacterium]